MTEQNQPPLPPFGSPPGGFGSPPGGFGAPPGGGGGFGGAPPGPPAGGPPPGPEQPGTTAHRELGPERLVTVTFQYVRRVLTESWRTSVPIAFTYALIVGVLSGASTLSLGSEWTKTVITGGVGAFFTEHLISLMLLGVFALATAVWGMIQTGALIHVSSETLAGRRPTVGTAIQVGLQRAIYVFATNLVMGVAIVVGLALCCIPGIYLMVVLWTATAATVIERLGPIQAMTRVRNLSRGIFWSVALNAVVFALVTIVIALPFLCVNGLITGVSVFASKAADPAAVVQQSVPVVILTQAIGVVQTTVVAILGQAWITALFTRIVELREPKANAGIAETFA